MFRTTLMLAVVSALGAGPVAADVHIQGRVVDQSGLALPGVSIQLATATAADEAKPAGGTRTTVSDADGAFSFDVPVGTYRLTTALDGFEAVTREVRVTGAMTVPDVVLGLGHFSSETTVVAQATTELQSRQFGTGATLAEAVIENAPQRSSRYEDLLPMLPNVVRGPDGLVSVAGARAPAGVVLLNGITSSDVASGEPMAPVPMDAIKTVQVIATDYAAEFGPATGGVTVINSRSGSDAYHYAINSFTPRLRFEGGDIHGIESFEPNASVRGPIAHGKAWFAQSLDYHWERTPVDTLDGRQDRRQNGFTSMTELDTKLDNGDFVTAWVNGRNEHVNGAHLSAFTPLGTVPLQDTRSWTGAAIDRKAFGTSTFEARISLRDQDTSLTPDGTGPYLAAHDGASGAYFEAVDRHAWSVDASSVVSRMISGAAGSHLVKAGASLEYRQLDGFEQAAPVIFLRSDLVPASRVEFVGPGVYSARSTAVGAFAQDEMTVSARLTVNVGVRLDHDTRIGTLVAPRGGVTWKLSESTLVSGGAGWFTGDMPLAALAVEGYQSRRVTTYDAAGVPVGVPVTYWNALSANLGRPQARIFSGRVDQQLARGWQLRAAYQERRGTSEAIVTPALLDGGAAALLSTGGASHSRSLETTLGYHPAGSAHQFYASYVRSSSDGNTNDFNQVDGLYRDPRLEAAQLAPLPADVPHRVLTWGIFSLPYRMTLAPFLDIRSGFPYSAVYDNWSYAGPRYSQRYPVFVSLDFVVNKTVSLPGGARAVVGVRVYNVTGRSNGRDVQADIARPDFGQTYNSVGRQYRATFEIIWGEHRK